MSFYEEFLGEKILNIDQLAIQYPIAVSKDYRIKDDELIRTPFGINREDKSITYTGEVPEGSKIRMMMAVTDNLVDGSEKAAKQLFDLHKKNDNNQFLLIPVSCLTRKLVMGEFVDDELESIRDQFKSQKYVVNGFYSFGEIATDAAGVCSLHNQTMNLIMVYEK
ncbi:MAG TPA: FIST C-terminal domain-containing protein [Oligoflexus sp.]|uniref:FIST C-terminal domain-containing protein n=1 Tax=Oligoflexus sp. TaxID=1971216 RepID=UPI002D48A628|nr:FIST C-terminal domain-containing protein [Oligoflexus sp.]HYX32161.1 FIST C-terminal domain-containing protein [Oligoflexus sp.]